MLYLGLYQRYQRAINKNNILFRFTNKEPTTQLLAIQ